MFPLIRNGDAVRIIRDTKPFKRGQVIAFQQKGSILIHRIIRWEGSESECFTKGDGNLGPDPPVRRADIIGRVSLVKRGDRLIAVPETLDLADFSEKAGRWGYRLNTFFPKLICRLVCIASFWFFFRLKTFIPMNSAEKE